MLAPTPKTNAGLRSRLASTRDLPTIAFFRAAALLRRNGPVPGILAAHRPGAIMDKSERPFCGSVWVPPKPQIDPRYFTHANKPKTCNLQAQSVTYVLNQKCYLCSDCATAPTPSEPRTPNPEPP
jgi:hypothetical protein